MAYPRLRARPAFRPARRAWVPTAPAAAAAATSAPPVRRAQLHPRRRRPFQPARRPFLPTTTVGDAPLPPAPDPVEGFAPAYQSTAQRADVTVWLQALDGTWEACGTQRAIDVVPESLVCESDASGSKTASFDLRRPPFMLWPDLAAFAPCVIEIAGTPRWSGRTLNTPIRDGADFVINVQCEGMQFHLDDDSYRRIYVHTDLSAWRDARSFLDSDLTFCKTNGTVQAGDGAILIGFGNGAPVATNDVAGVILDLGPGGEAKRVIVEWENRGVVAGSYRAFVKVIDKPADIVGGGENLASFDPGSGASPATGTATTARRYAVILIQRTGAPATETGDRLLRVRAVRVFGDTAFESGNVSVLKASTAINDALGRATMLLASDRSGIATSSYSIPDYAPDRGRTPREVAEHFNGYHNWILKLDAQNRPLFKPRPTTPLLEIGNWSGASLEDVGANAGSSIYNRCVVEGEGPDGSLVVVTRWDQSLAQTPSVAAAQFPDPSFEAGVTGWRATTGSIAHETSDAYLGSDCARTGSEGTTVIQTSATGLDPGRLYEIRPAFKTPAGQAFCDVTLLVEDEQGNDLGTVSFTTSTGLWEIHALRFVAPQSGTVTLTLTKVTTIDPRFSAVVRFDAFQLYVGSSTIVDRRRFRRTMTLLPSFKLVPASAIQLADTYLQAHRTTPYRGSCKIRLGGVRYTIGGGAAHPSVMLTMTQELLHLSHRIDPDTGASGRNATIATVRYTHRDELADTELDDPRRDFEALLARMGVAQKAVGV